MTSAIARYVSTSKTHPGTPHPLPTTPSWRTTQVTYLVTKATLLGPTTQWGTPTSIHQSVPVQSILSPILANIPMPTVVAATENSLVLSTDTGPFEVLLPGRPVAIFAPMKGVIVECEERQVLEREVGREFCCYYLESLFGELICVSLPERQRVLGVLKDLPLVLSRGGGKVFVWAIKEDDEEDEEDESMKDCDEDEIGQFVREAVDVKEEIGERKKSLELRDVYEGKVHRGGLDVFLAHDLGGRLVLCLVNGGVLTGLSFWEKDGLVGGMVAAFRIMDVSSATGVLGMRRGEGCLDIVVRHGGGNLSLFMGRNRLCGVELGDVPKAVWVGEGRVGEGVGGQFSVFSKESSVRFTLEEVTFGSSLLKRCFGAVCFVFERRGIMLRITTLYHAILRWCGKGIGEDGDWNIFEKVLLRACWDGRELVCMEMDDAAQADEREEIWNALLGSEYHTLKSRSLSFAPIVETRMKSGEGVCEIDEGRSADIETLRHVLLALHLVYEDQKLSALTENAELRLARLNVRLAKAVRAESYIDHYRRDWGNLQLFGDVDVDSALVPDHVPVPSIMDYLAALARGEGTDGENFQLLNPRDLPETQSPSLTASWRAQSPAVTSARVVKYYLCLFSMKQKESSYVDRAEAVLLAMVDDNFSVVDLESLPFGVALPLQDALFACRQHPKQTWPFHAFVLIGREDLFNFSDFDLKKASTEETERAAIRENRAFRQIQAAAASLTQTEDSSLLRRRDNLLSSEQDARKTIANLGADGCDMHGHLYQLRFCVDRRVEEVRRILRSTDATVMTTPATPSPDAAPDFDMASAQRRKLERLVRKRYAAPIGRGAFTLRTFVPSDPTKPLPVPKICTTGALLGEKGSKVSLTDTDLVDVEWGEFHNGVAAGLRIVSTVDERESESAGILTRQWIVNHRPTDASDGANHAGMLLALGLGGYLPTLKTTDYYEYLLPRHELTSIGLILGLALGNLGSKEEKVTKMLCLHIKYFNEPGFAIPDFSVSIKVQTAAILGLGFLHQGSCEHVILDGLFVELGRRPRPGQNIDDREGLALAAGISIGLVCLGTGSAAFDVADRRMIDRLVLFANGGPGESVETVSTQIEAFSMKSEGIPSLERSSSAPADSEASRIKEGNFVNTDVVSPGALLAIGLIYLKTHDRRMADRIIIPTTLYSLDRTRPDHVFLRVLVRSLILWNDIQASHEWILETLPQLVRPAPSVNGQNVFDLRGRIMVGGGYGDQDIDVSGILHARSFAIAGACTAIALKYAGSSDPAAISLLTNACESFERVLLQEEKEDEPVTWVTMTCLSSLALALAIVTAGSGKLEVFRLFRRLRKRRGKPSKEGKYGYHVAIHMAIGFLFMGGGCQTFDTSNVGIVGLLCSIYPRFPEDVKDNQYHLQALRHLYVLATEPRYIETRDVDTGLPCCVDVEIQLANGSSMKTRAPCIVPESSRISQVAVVSERYWPKTVEINPAVPGKGWFSKTKGQTLFVKRRTGHLPYSSDPKGSKGILARSLCRPRPSTDSNAYFAQVEHLVRAFSADSEVLAFVKYFCRPSSGPCTNGKDWSEPNEQTRRQVEILYECLSNDKPETVRMYMNAERASSAIVQGHASPSTVGSLMIATNYIASPHMTTTHVLQASYLCRLIRTFQDKLYYREVRKAVVEYVRSGGKTWPSAQGGKHGRNLVEDLGMVLRLKGMPSPRAIGDLTVALKVALERSEEGGAWLCFAEGQYGEACATAVECVLDALAMEKDTGVGGMRGS